MTARLANPLSLAVVGVCPAAFGLGLLAGARPTWALAVAFGTLFLVLVLADPAVGVCGLIAISILDAQGNLGSTKLAGAVLAASWLLSLVLGRREGRRTFAQSHAGLLYALVVFLAWVLLSTLWAESTSATVEAFARYVPNVLLIPIVFDATRERKHAVWVLVTLLLSTTSAALLGLVEPPSDPSGADAGRVSSTVGDANQLAAALVVGAALAGAFAARSRNLSPWRWAATAAMGVCLLTIFLTLSRGGLVALSAAMVAAVVFSGRWRARALVVAGLIAVGAVTYFSLFASLPARERVTNVGGGTGRLDLWTVGGRMVDAQPLVGVGGGNFQVASVHYLLRPGVIERADFIISTPKVAHNTYLQAAAELGIPVALLFVGIVLFCVGCAVRAAWRFERDDDVPWEILARGLLVAMVGYLTALAFISEMYSKLLWVLLALGPAMLALSARPAEGRRT